MVRAAKKKAEAADIVPPRGSGTGTTHTKSVEDRKANSRGTRKKANYILAVTNLKGGVAKTTTACNVGLGMVNSGLTCLIVDLDMQANATSDLGFDIAQVQGAGSAWPRSFRA